MTTIRETRLSSDIASLDTQVPRLSYDRDEVVKSDVKVDVENNMLSRSHTKSTYATALKSRNECSCCYCYNKPPKGANPYPLVMFAFGLSNILLGQYNCRLVPFDVAGISQGFMYAGLGQTLCGCFAFGNGNTIGAFMGLTFGGWWYALMTSIWLPSLGWNVPTIGMNAFWYNIVWALFLILNLIVVSANGRKDVMNPTSMTLVTITSTCVGLQGAFPPATVFLRIAGIACTLSGIVGTYIASSAFLEEIYGRPMLPIGFPSSSDQSEQQVRESLPK